jgi:hypothetical protein
MLKKIFYACFFGWIFLYILVYLKPELHFHIQQPSFFNTWDFFAQYLLNPGGIGEYTSKAIMQGFYYNWLGSLIILFLAASLSVLLYMILKKLNLIKNLFLLFFPFSLAIVLFNDYYFPLQVLIQSVFIFLAVFLLTQITHLHKIAIVYSVLVYILLYYIFGSGTALVFSLSGLLVFYLSLPFKVFLKQGIALSFLSVLFPFIAYTFIFNLSYTQAYFLFLPEVPVTLSYSFSLLKYTFVFILPILLIFDFFATKSFKSNHFLIVKLKDIGNNKTDLFPALIHAIFLVGFMLVFMSLSMNKHQRNIVQCDFYGYQGNWDKVIDIALSDNEYDLSINLNYNRAIDHTGKFLQEFFDYPQLLGLTSLFPDNLKTPVYSMLASDYYFDINYVSKSQHWAYAALTMEPYNTRILKRLTLTNLILGNTSAAQTYLNVLAQNPNSSEFVGQYLPYIKDSARIADDPYLSKKISLQPINFAIPAKITDRLADLISRDSMNRQAYEHLQMCYLLEHDLGKFMNIFDESLKFYNQIPPVYEQAFILYLYSIGETRSKVNISEYTKSQFKLFMDTLKKCNNSKEEAEKYLSSLKNTYMYYISYLSPKITNISVEIKKQ